MKNKINENNRDVALEVSLDLDQYEVKVGTIDSNLKKIGNIANNKHEENFGDKINVFRPQLEMSNFLEKLEKPKLNAIVSIEKQTEKDIFKNEPFEYANNYGYLYTRLKRILDNNDISGRLKDDLYCLLETLGELRILGVYNEPYKRYRRAFDNYLMDLNRSEELNSDFIGELRYLCYQSSASGRKELKLIDKSIKEWNKRNKENKLLHSYRDAMSDWLNKNDLCLNKPESQKDGSKRIFKDILDSTNDMNSPLQNSLFLSFLSISYISEKLYPYMSINMNSNTVVGTQAPTCVNNDVNKAETPTVSNSFSSIDGDTENNTIENQLIEESDNLLLLDTGMDLNIKNNENMANNSKITQSESVMNWIRNNNNRKQSENLENDGKTMMNQENDDSIEAELNRLISMDKNDIILNKIINKNVDIRELLSGSVELDKKDLLREFIENYQMIYSKFLSIKENLHRKRRYYKSIPTLGSNRFKKQFIENDEVCSRQFQSIYNNDNLRKIPNKIRRVLIYRSEWKRPPMYLLITHMGNECNGVNPLAREEHINYDVDTDEEWEEHFGGEDVDNIDDGVENYEDDDDNEAVVSGWLVPDGCFQFDELLEDNVLNTTTDNNGNNNMVNLLCPLSSQYPAPVVISFLNHNSIDFGVGISLPSETCVQCLQKEYLIFFPQGVDWIYEKSKNAIEGLSKDFLDQKVRDNSKNTKISENAATTANRKSVLDFSLKQELSYFIHGKWISIKKIIAEFMNLNSDRNIKRTAIIHFIKENVYRAKIAGDIKPRWYVKEDVADLNLDLKRLNELLDQRKLDEKITTVSNKQNFMRTDQTKLNIAKEFNSTSNSLTPIHSSQNSQTTNSSRKEKQLETFNSSIEIKGIEDFNFETRKISVNNENANLNSQISIRSIDDINFNSDLSSYGNEGSDIHNGQLNYEDYNPKNQIGTLRKRRYLTPNRDMSNKNKDISYFDSERKKPNIQESERIKSNTPELKRNSNSTIHNNSLITQFFPPKK